MFGLPLQMLDGTDRMLTDDEHMSVVFSTYHSIDLISRAQHEHNLAAFDLVICDEAHSIINSGINSLIYKDLKT